MQGQGDNKHSIDSDDEEDDRQKFDQFDKMAEDDMLMEGQEDDTVAQDGEIKITPFNLKEEQQEGSFSKDGNFVWNKKDEVKDAWLDNVDMQKVCYTSQHIISILFSLSLILNNSWEKRPQKRRKPKRQQLMPRTRRRW